MAKWFVAAKRADFDSIAREFGISPVLARIIRNRDIIKKEDIRKYLSGTADDFYDPFLLKGMKEAVAILEQKIISGASLRVIGDYDVDGICATYILFRGLGELGGKADTVIPHRRKDGYGLNDNLIAEAAKAGIDTIITCDNGIAAASQIASAKELGMTVIVTDHHEVPFEEKENGEKTYCLPLADAVVDPKQQECPYPYKNICGGVVAEKVIEALFRKMNRKIPPALLEELRCLAALATVCDVMELADENRILVKYGLSRMKETANMGLRALMEVNGIGDKPLSPYHAGFILGPCLNATGRLDTAERALTLFCTTEYRQAVAIAADLKELNESRKEMTARGVAEAIALVEAETKEKQGMDKVLVLYLPECHESLAGIVAGRIRERFGRPSFVLTRGEEEVKGSGRSIDAYHMYDEMSKCKELFLKYGGHKLAAGLSMQEKDIEEFRRRLNDSTLLTEEDFEETVHIDIPLPLSCITKEFIGELDKLEPFGPGNTKPLFAQKNIRLLKGTLMGKNKNAGKYTVADETNHRFEMIYFGNLERFHCFLEEKYSRAQVEKLYAGAGAGEAGEVFPSTKVNPYKSPLSVKEEMFMEISMAYYPDLNRYMGRENIQIVMQNYC